MSLRDLYGYITVVATADSFVKFTRFFIVLESVSKSLNSPVMFLYCGVCCVHYSV